MAHQSLATCKPWTGATPVALDLTRATVGDATIPAPYRFDKDISLTDVHKTNTVSVVGKVPSGAKSLEVDFLVTFDSAVRSPRIQGSIFRMVLSNPPNLESSG